MINIALTDVATQVEQQVPELPNLSKDEITQMTDTMIKAGLALIFSGRR